MMTYTEQIEDSMFDKLEESEKDTEFIAMESKTFLKDACDCFN